MRIVLTSLASLLLLAACDNSGVVELKGASGTTVSDDTAASDLTLDVDSDGDGTVDEEDCRPSDPDAYPGAIEVCDGVDNDCDGLVDQDDDSLDLSTRIEAWPDADGDGYGDADADAEWVCEPALDQSTRPTDCDDGDAHTSPEQVEVCDGIDNDCDSDVDDDDTSVEATDRWYPDVDGDGFGNADSPGELACEAPRNSVSANTDCDDLDADIHPEAQEVCDSLNLDEDCDGRSDDGDPDTDVTTMTTWYVDADEDGFGDTLDAGRLACDDPTSGVTDFTTDHTDCLDSDDSVYPGATEVCENGLDDDCDGDAAECRVAGTLQAWSDADEYHVDWAYYQIGTTISAGDFDGDGKADLIASAPRWYEHSGAGSFVPSRLAITTGFWSGYFEDFDHLFIGEEYDDGAGDAVSMTGDVNGDGYADVLIGSPSFDVEGGLSSAGTAHLIFGGSMPAYSVDSLDDLVDTYGGARWTGINTDGLGSILAIAGDMNGDGHDDVLVGGGINPLLRSHPGMVYLMLGATSLASGSADDEALAMFYTDGATLGWDNRLAFQTDLDGDGLSDLAMSAANELPGQAYVVFGATSLAQTGDVLLDADADALLVGTDISDYLGWALAGVEDMNGDGYDELAATSPFYTSSTTSSGGRMFLFYGSTTGWSLGMDAEASAHAIVEGDADDLDLGEAVASGDLDGDGHGDVAVSGEDAVFTFYGPLTGTTLTSSAPLTIESESGWGSIGDQLLMADFTGDGVDDLVTSSPTVSAVFRYDGVGP